MNISQGENSLGPTSRTGVDKLNSTNEIQALQIFINKALLQIAVPISLQIVYGCFHAQIVELSSCDKNYLAPKACNAMFPRK